MLSEEIVKNLLKIIPQPGQNTIKGGNGKVGVY